jgi:hypothetical protein
MEVGKQVAGTPLIPCSCPPVSARLVYEMRRSIDHPVEGRLPMVFFYGQRNDTNLYDGFFFFFEVPLMCFPTGRLYAEFRRQVSLVRRGLFDLDKVDQPIIIATDCGMDFVAYLIIRWTVDELSCSIESAYSRFVTAFSPSIYNDDTFRSLSEVFTHDPEFPLRYRSHAPEIPAAFKRHPAPARALTPEQKAELNKLFCFCNSQHSFSLSAVSSVDIEPPA